MTLKFTGVFFFFVRDSENGQRVTELTDSPGHVDVSSKVIAAVRVTDGDLVVVDFMMGSVVKTQVVLSQAWAVRIFPNLFVDKVDRCSFESQVGPVYNSFQCASAALRVPMAIRSLSTTRGVAHVRRGLFSVKHLQ